METSTRSKVLLGFLLAGMTALGGCEDCQCGQRAFLASVAVRDAIETRKNVNEALIGHTAEHGWYLTSGRAFLELAGELDPYYLPEEGASPPYDVVNTQHIDAFDVSPDGTLMVTETRDRDNPDEPMHLVVYDADLNVVWEDEELVHYDHPSPYRWSPDGTSISYAVGNDVFVLDWATKQARVVASNHTKVAGDGPPYGTPTWSADSARLAYQTDDGQIAILDLETGEAKKVADGRVPSWSPDGKWIAYRKGRVRDLKAMLYEVESGQTRELFDTVHDYQFVWTPDSEYILFAKTFPSSRHAYLWYYSLADEQVFNTGKITGGLRHSQVVELPGQFREKLVLMADNEESNPNR